MKKRNIIILIFLVLAMIPSITSAESNNTEARPCPDDISIYYPTLSKCEAETRAESLRNYTIEHGEPTWYHNMPALSSYLQSFGFDEDDLKYIADQWQYINITMHEQQVGVCASRFDLLLVLEIDGIAIFDLDANGRLDTDDTVYFTYNNSELLFYITNDTRAMYPEEAEFSDWIYPVILATSKGFDVEPNTEMVGLFDIPIRVKDFILWKASSEKGLKEQWTSYPGFLLYRGVPTKIVQKVKGKVLLRQSGDKSFYYSPGVYTMYISETSYDNGKLKHNIGKKHAAQIYHEFVHAYWALYASKAKKKSDEGGDMGWILTHIAKNMKHKYWKNNCGKNVSPTLDEAMNYAEETIAYTAQTLCEFHYEFYNNKTIFKTKTTLTSKGNESFKSRMERGSANGYFKRGSKYHYFDYTTRPTHNTINKILKSLGSDLRISGNESWNDKEVIKVISGN